MGEEMAGALQAFYAGQWDESIAQFESILAQEPQNTLAMAYILDAYYRKKDVDGIVSQIETETAANRFSASVFAHPDTGTRTVLKTEDNSYSFDVFIDARGQRPLKVKDIPFPGLREQLQKTGDEIPDVGEDYTLQQPEDIRGRVAFGALPWLMHDQPFVQGLTACAEIGEAMARAVVKPASRARRRLSFD